MTATERLRQLLDERGEHYETSGSKTWWGRPVDSRTGEYINVYHNQAQPMGEDRLFVEMQLATPEQAVEATLGCEPNDKEMLRLHDRLNVALLRLERNVDNGNERIAAIAEAHELLEDAATLGRGTCRMELPDLRGPAYTDVYVCSECGGEVMVGTVMGVSDVPKWCPWCGRKVEQ